MSQNRRHKSNTRITPSIVNKLEAFLLSIATQGWGNTPIGRTAERLTVKIVAKEYRRPQVGLHIPYFALL